MSEKKKNLIQHSNLNELPQSTLFIHFQIWLGEL